MRSAGFEAYAYATRCHRVGLALIAAWLAAGSIGAQAATIYVRAQGDDRADGQSAKTAFQTLDRAAAALNHGDNLVIGPGTYPAAAVLAERYSADGALMRVSGDESGRQTGDPAGPVVIENRDLAQPALRFSRFRNLEIAGLTFRGAGDGLVLDNCRGVRIARCTFSGLRRGISARTVEGLQIESCVVAQCTVGISLFACSQTRLAHATVVNASTAGALVLGCGPGSIRNSILAGNNSNFVLDRISAPSWSSDANVIHGTSGPWGLAPMVYFAAEWYAAAGQDRHSVYVVPSFADPSKGDYRVAPQVVWPGGLPGAQVGAALDPAVTNDRDGRPFRVRDGAVCAGAYDYPDPQPGPGWRALKVALQVPAGRRLSAGIYRPDGSLLRTLVADVAGVRELWWDGRDDLGQPVVAGDYQVRTSVHDVRIEDDGHFGDNGNPLGTYNCDNGDRLVVLPDGRFVVSTIYDEAGIPLRFYSASGQSLAGVNLAEKDIWGLATAGDGFVAGVNLTVARVGADGDRMKMATGAPNYPLLAAGEALPTGARPAGLAVIGTTVYAALPGLDVVRSLDLATGNKLADWKLAAPADLAAAPDGLLWAISGTEVVALKADGQVAKRFPTGLTAPRYLAANATQLAVVDRVGRRIAVLDAANGKVVHTLFQAWPADRWSPVSGALLRDPRGVAFLPDGRLLVCEAARIRAIWPDTARVSLTVESNFMDVAVPHPTKPEFVYCHGGTAFRVDPASGAWQREAEGPASPGFGSVSTPVVLGGRPFVVAFVPATTVTRTVDGAERKQGVSQMHFLDVSEPLKPRLAGVLERPANWAYATVAFTREGHLVERMTSSKGGYALRFHVVPFTGLDAQHNPRYDVAAARVVGPENDPTARDMGYNGGFSVDPVTDDFYYMAVTAQHKKMVPAWGASGTGVGRSRPDGTPLWFALSSGGNYTSLDCVNDGRQSWILAGKDFGGQLDLFDADGLRLATGNWGWPCNWQMGFVDLRFAVQAYMRPDGKPGVWVEDDNVGRFARARLDGADTLQKATLPLVWDGQGAAAGVPPLADLPEVAQPLAQPLRLARVPELKVDGAWQAWEQAGVVPQVISLPTVTWGRSWPDDLFQTYRAGTSIGALAHDGRFLYVYFVVADDTPHFDAEAPGMMWAFDSVELWLEEEQIGIGFTRDGQPSLFKYRYHNREGKEWAANYAMPQGQVWGQTYASLATHPLGRQLASATGVSFEGKPGYALMARIPFDEIKLVGGIAGRLGGQIQPMTGAAGETIRIGVAFDGINAWGREQDFKVYWPIGLMFSDPTRNVPFVLAP